MSTPDSIAIVSGGLDSVTLVYDMLAKGYQPHVLSFDYGQRHKKELKFAQNLAVSQHLRHDIVNLSGLTHLIANSALTSDYKEAEGNDIIEVPEGHYAEDSMKATVVPNRNMIMLSIAAGIAVNNGYETIATGVHSGDHFIYPDCRPEFIQSFIHTVMKGNEGLHKLKKVSATITSTSENKAHHGGIYVPFINGTKADIVIRAMELRVPLHVTWSCYKGGENHCGRCGTCVERLEAIHLAQEFMNKRYPGTVHLWEDHTVYDDGEFWKITIKEGNK